jgi:AcrR family transcriptional regulator
VSFRCGPTRQTEAVTIRAQRRPGRPTGGQPVADRDLLLDAAERALRRDGSGVSLEAIAVEAGVTKPVIYARIGDRSEVAAALAQRLADRLVSAGTEALDGRGFERAALAALIEATLRTIAAHRELFVYVTSGVTGDTAQGTLQLAGRSAGWSTSRPSRRDTVGVRRNRHVEPGVALVDSRARSTSRRRCRTVGRPALAWFGGSLATPMNFRTE